ncbi:hypothetical protein KF840_24020 [bacterium]|nr:hypothetical protein [bacterium]
MRRAILAVAMMMACAGRSGAACVGDCGGDGEVTVDEMVRGVTIALGSGRVDQCRAFDADGDGTVTINELVAAVGNALGGCPLVGATPIPTPTMVAVTPTTAVTPTIGAGCGDGTFTVTISDVSGDSNVSREAFSAGKGRAVDSGPGPYVWAIAGEPCARPLGEVVRSFAINVSDAPARLLPGTYAITVSTPPFIRVDYRENKFVPGNPSQSFSHQWLSTGGTLEVSDAGGGAVRVHARGVTMDVGPTYPGAVGTFSLDISGTVTVTHN